MHVTALTSVCIYIHAAGALLHGTVREPAREGVTRGILIGGSNKFNLQLLTTVHFLRKHGARLPIQVWKSGDELGDELANSLLSFPGVEIRDVHEPDPKQWQGYQIKAIMVEKTELDEVILVDADVRAERNFEELFSDPKYLQTGTLFFRDRLRAKLPDAEWLREHNVTVPVQSLNNLPARAAVGPTQLLGPDHPCSGDCMRRAMHPAQSPSHAHEVDFGFHGQCSSVVVLNRTKHALGIQQLARLNRDYKRTYQHMHGDRDTFWVALSMAHEPFAFVSTLPGHDEEAGWMGEASYFYTDDGTLNHVH